MKNYDKKLRLRVHLSIYRYKFIMDIKKFKLTQNEMEPAQTIIRIKNKIYLCQLLRVQTDLKLNSNTLI